MRHVQRPSSTFWEEASSSDAGTQRAMMCGRHLDVQSDSLLPRLMETRYLIKKCTELVSGYCTRRWLLCLCPPVTLLHSQLTTTPGGRVAAAHCSLTGWMAHIWRRSFTSLWWCLWDFKLKLLTCRGFVATGDSIMLPNKVSKVTLRLKTSVSRFFEIYLLTVFHRNLFFCH